MLAYVFWHYPKLEFAGRTYESNLREFHAALAAAAIAGFHGSHSYRVDSLPWINAGGAAYEDWYLLSGSEGLDRLNDAAVSERRRGPHDVAAHAAAAGAGGLYRLRAGEPAPAATSNALWFSKPEGMTYDAFDEELRPLLQAGRALWQRQMVLGPSLEFCLSDGDPSLSPIERALKITRFSLAPPPV